MERLNVGRKREKLANHSFGADVVSVGRMYLRIYICAYNTHMSFGHHQLPPF